MLTIWKYPLETAEFEIEAPEKAEALTVQVQNGTPMLWLFVNHEAPKTKYRVWLVGTGHKFPKAALYSSYIGTFQLPSMSLVFHVFSDLKNYDGNYKPMEL